MAASGRYGTVDIYGWSDFVPYVYDPAVERFPNGSVFVEVGCWLGASVIYLAQAARAAGKQFSIFAVDNFVGSPCDGLDATLAEWAAAGQGMWEQFNANLVLHGVADAITPIREPSQAGAERFANHTCDFVFIDADHTYEAVVADIAAWRPKMLPGGLLAGHDMNRPPVVQAVQEAFGGRHRVTENGMSWLYDVPV
jgi:predicted O-methyltransferase YrrM